MFSQNIRSFFGMLLTDYCGEASKEILFELFSWNRLNVDFVNFARLSHVLIWYSFIRIGTLLKLSLEKRFPMSSCDYP